MSIVPPTSPETESSRPANVQEDEGENSIWRRRLRHAQQNISFLQEQHKATLSDLHSELDRLKLQNKEQQWRLVLAGQLGHSNFSETELIQKFSNLSTQTDPALNEPETSVKLKIAEEENADLRNEIDFLRKANERFKCELLNQSKKLEISTRQPEPRRLVKPNYRNKYSPRAATVANLRVISRPGYSGSQNLPSIHGCVEAVDSGQRAKTVTLPALRGVNQNIKHQRRLDAINFRKLN